MAAVAITRFALRMGYARDYRVGVVQPLQTLGVDFDMTSNSRAPNGPPPPVADKLRTL